MGIAEPGSGKTLGYLLPAVAHVLGAADAGQAEELECPAALVLVPTRELALQVASVCRGFYKDAGIRAQAIIGGVDKDLQVLLRYHLARHLQFLTHLVNKAPNWITSLYFLASLDMWHTKDWMGGSRRSSNGFLELLSEQISDEICPESFAPHETRFCSHARRQPVSLVRHCHRYKGLKRSRT